MFIFISKFYIYMYVLVNNYLRINKIILYKIKLYIIKLIFKSQTFIDVKLLRALIM